MIKNNFKIISYYFKINQIFNFLIKINFINNLIMIKIYHHQLIRIFKQIMMILVINLYNNNKV